MDLKLGDSKMAGLWWGWNTFLQHQQPKSRTCPQTEASSWGLMAEWNRDTRKLLRAGLKEAFHLSQNKLSADARLFRSLSTENKALSAIFCGFNKSSTTCRWDVLFIKTVTQGSPVCVVQCSSPPIPLPYLVLGPCAHNQEESWSAQLRGMLTSASSPGSLWASPTSWPLPGRTNMQWDMQHGCCLQRIAICFS